MKLRARVLNWLAVLDPQHCERAYDNMLAGKRWPTQIERRKQSG